MQKYNPKRIIFFITGWIFVALGIIGIVIPLMPTTPFLLIALFCFSHSSEPFHDWLFNHKVIGKPLRDWHKTHRIPMYVKVIMGITITLSISILIYPYI